MSEETTIEDHPRAPARLEEMTPGWVSAALAAKGYAGVTGVEVLEILRGTATKLRLKLTRSGAAAALPETLWAKAGFEKHSAIRQEVYAGEVYFYNTFAQSMADIAPRCFYADREPKTGASIVLLDDLCAYGARFCDILQPLTADEMARALEMIANYHARHWQSPALAQDAFLANGGAYVAADVLGRKFTQATYDRITPLPRFKELPAALRDMDRLRDAFYAVQKFWRDGPCTLNHGDAHVGQACRLPDGAFRLLDWQCAKFSNWAQDVAYFMISGLAIADRRAAEDDLLARYLAALTKHGCAAPAFADARETLRLHALHGMGWCLTGPELQPEENCAALTSRFAAAMLDYGTIARALR